MRVHAERALVVPVDDGVRNLGFGVTASRAHVQHLGSCGDVLGDGGDVLAVLEDGRVVVEVQHGHGHRADGGEGAGPATVRGAGSKSVRRAELTVEGCGQAEHAGVLVDRERSVGRIQQRVYELGVSACADKEKKKKSKESENQSSFHLFPITADYS